MDWTPSEGDIVGDRFRLEEFLGKGGISTVWKGLDEETGDRVAIKAPNYDSANDPAIVKESLQSELEILEGIREAGGHPHVMELLDSVVQGDTLFIVVGFIEGEVMLDAVERRNGITDPEDLRRVGIALCEAMSFLHRNGLIYRDLKPDNVMLQEDLWPILIDFNTAKGFEAQRAGDGSGTSGTVIPNPVYKPPELNNDPELVGYRQGPWSDVYSIGKLLMFMLSGSGVRKDAVDPRDFPGTRATPEYLALIIEKSTQKHKDDRYRNATVLARVLEARSPDPPDLATFVNLKTGEEYEIYPGDTMGRQGADGPQPAIALEDPDKYISAVQVEFDQRHDGTWVLQDHSLNGTWIRDGDGWDRVLSEYGRDRLVEKGDDPSEDGEMPPEERVLEPGDEIALVHPEYPIWLRFEGEA
ncbi:MAG: FHA domain-containing serine/threonine-protein kinase [Haloarculaceae archaeon]